jgi:outer membrane lipoprotein-sorting protein
VTNEIARNHTDTIPQMLPGSVPPRRVAIGIVGSLLLVGVVTAAVAVTGDSPAERPIGANASERYAAVDGVTATVTTVVERGDDRNRTVHRVAMRPADGDVFLETLSGPSTGPEVVASNGSTRWAYDRDDGLVRRSDAASLASRLRDRGDRIERLFGELNRTTTADRSTPRPGVSPLPAIPTGPGTGTPSPVGRNASRGEFDVSYEGTATVAGRRTHVLSLRPADADATDADVRQTLWIDADRFVPLKYRTNWTEAGEPVERTVAFSNVSFGADIPAERFRFEPPAGAAVVTPTLGANAAERIASIDGVAATVRTRSTGLDLNVTNRSGNRSDLSTVARLQVRPETGERRVETRRGSSYGADLVVSNGTTMWSYDGSANEVRRTDDARLNGGAFARRGDQIERLFARLEGTATSPGDTGDAGPGVVSFPGTAMTRPGPAPAVPPDAADGYGVELVGAERVDGRTAYVLRVEAEAGTNGTFGNYSRTMWIDADRYFPLKQRTAFTNADGDRVTFTTTYTNVTFDPDFEPGTFEFEPPANATVTDSGIDGPETYDSRAALAANTTDPVPDPTVPPDFTLDTARRFDSANVSSVGLVYANETAQLSVSRVTLDGRDLGNLTAANRSRTTAVTVDGRNGSYSRMGPYASVVVACGESRLSVSGSAVSKSLLTTVAASVDCP